MGLLSVYHWFNNHNQNSVIDNVKNRTTFAYSTE